MRQNVRAGFALFSVFAILGGWGERVRVAASAPSPVAATPAAPAPDPVLPHQTFTIDSRALDETRVINLYTPPGYDEAAGTGYPVLYVLDGGVGEDFPHVTSDIDAAIRAGEMRPVVVVGIENTERRRDMTGPTEVEADRKIAPRVGGSAAFRAFIRDELMPEIDRRVRGNGQTAIVGESLAGLFVVETFFQEPRLFDVSIALSPSLWWNAQALVKGAKARLRARPRSTQTLYLASAGDDDRGDAVRGLAEALRAAAPKGLTWYYEPWPDEKHSTIYRAASPQVFRKLFPPVSVGVSHAESPQLAERFLRRTLDGAPYRLFVPTESRGRKSLPLVVFLHGGAGRGSDNERQLRDGNGMLAAMFAGAEKEFPAFVLAPQTSSEHRVEKTLAILDDVRARYRIDGRRIYAVGQSLGGYGVLDLLAARPRLFAAAIVIAAGGEPSRAQSLAAVPTWFFHGEKDELIPVEGVRRLVAAVKGAGGTVRFTEYAGEGHGLAWLVVRERELVPWIFAQRRELDSVPAPRR